MHHALCIAEILENILVSLSDHQSLARLARTCRAFTESSLDALWRDQTTLVNFFTLLPSDCWEIEGSFYAGWHRLRLVLRRTPQPEDWVIHSKYRARVRFLDLIDTTLAMVPSEVFDALALAFPGGTVFPNLVHLSWTSDPSRPPMLYHLSLLASPSVTSIIFSMHDSAARLGASMALITETFDIPKLKTVKLFYDATSSYIAQPETHAFAQRLSRIQTLSLPAVNQATLAYIATLPDLAHLDLFDDDDARPSFSPISTGSLPFPTLTHLDLKHTTLDVAMGLFSAVRSWRLQEIVVGYTPLASETSTAELYRCIATRCEPDILVTLRIARPVGGEIDAEQPELVMDGHAASTFGGLINFKHLTVVVLETPAGFIIDDIAVWRLACSWPRLTYLRLCTATTVQVAPKTSIDALRAFAIHCKHLRGLALAFDATRVPSFIDYRDQHATLPLIIALDVMYSPVGAPGPVARFLSGLFPHLKGIEVLGQWRWETDDSEAFGEEEEAQREAFGRWQEVLDRLVDIHAAREEERYLAGVAT
ncbi:hypothetical protein MKEN_00196300 [Mycena kentingensis (nom. inval.)]|nr:hypothetical protein MKEN_00196300 [Mycena kentingensis (nom. inval.)]